MSSLAAYLSAPPGGVDMTNLDYKEDKPMFYKYGVSKAGNLCIGRHMRSCIKKMAL